MSMTGSPCPIESVWLNKVRQAVLDAPLSVHQNFKGGYIYTLAPLRAGKNCIELRRNSAAVADLPRLLVLFRGYRAILK